MSASVTGTPSSAQKHKSEGEKKHKKHKDHDKKRPREDDDLPTPHRKHKRSKSEAVEASLLPLTPAATQDAEVNGESSHKKHKKHKKSKDADATAASAEPAEPAELPEADADASLKKKKKKDKKKKDKSVNGVDTASAEAAPEGEETPSAKPSKVIENEAPISGEDEDVEMGGEGETPAKKKKKKSKDKHKYTDESAVTNGEVAEPEAVADPEEPSGDAERGAEDDASAKQLKKKKSKDKHKAADESVITNREDAEAGPVADAEESSGKKKKREKRKSKDKRAEEAPQAEGGDEEQTASAPVKAKKKKKHRHEADVEVEPVAEPQPELDDLFENDAMDVDVPSPKPVPTTILQPANAPANPAFPFMTQRVSLYVPLYPVGFDQPLTKVADQHLRPLLNHYSPLVKGVLLDYRNVSLGEHPEHADPRSPPTDRTPATLVCVDEYAVGFGWLSAEVYLFKPRRGAWMEGVVNLQSEGHLGVVCWDRFNASIEASRVPRGWRFIDVVQRAEDAKKARFRNAGRASPATAAAAAGVNPENDKEEEEDNLDSLEQMHATGYWVDERGQRVRGKLRFRIKGFDVGLTGDVGYISIEGTMLDDDQEKALRASEVELEKARRQKSSGYLMRETRRVPEFSLTRFGREEEEEDASQKQPIYIASRPGTPDD